MPKGPFKAAAEEAAKKKNIFFVSFFHFFKGKKLVFALKLGVRRSPKRGDDLRSYMRKGGEVQNPKIMLLFALQQ